MWPNLAGRGVNYQTVLGCFKESATHPRINVFIADAELTGQSDVGKLVIGGPGKGYLISITQGDPIKFEPIINHEMLHAISGLDDVYSYRCPKKYLLVNSDKDGIETLEDHPPSILGPPTWIRISSIFFAVRRNLVFDPSCEI